MRYRSPTANLKPDGRGGRKISSSAFSFKKFHLLRNLPPFPLRLGHRRKSLTKKKNSSRLAATINVLLRETLWLNTFGVFICCNKHLATIKKPFFYYSYNDLNCMH